MHLYALRSYGDLDLSISAAQEMQDLPYRLRYDKAWPMCKKEYEIYVSTRSVHKR